MHYLPSQLLPLSVTPVANARPALVTVAKIDFYQTICQTNKILALPIWLCHQKIPVDVLWGSIFLPTKFFLRESCSCTHNSVAAENWKWNEPVYIFAIGIQSCTFTRSNKLLAQPVNNKIHLLADMKNALIQNISSLFIPPRLNWKRWKERDVAFEFYISFSQCSIEYSNFQGQYKSRNTNKPSDSVNSPNVRNSLNSDCKSKVSIASPSLFCMVCFLPLEWTIPTNRRHGWYPRGGGRANSWFC